MSEHIDNTQPNQPVQVEDTQPQKPVKKGPRWQSILIGALGLLLLSGLGAFGGFRKGLDDRLDARDSLITQQLAQQFEFAIVDIEFGRFEAAKQRLEFVIANDPTFPGAQEKLTEVLVKSSIPTPVPTATLSPTPDFSGAESAYQRAQQLILAQDWTGALSALDQIRKLDPTYKTAQVDGMYYFALRNYGHELIIKHGNLEGGIYHWPNALARWITPPWACERARGCISLGQASGSWIGPRLWIILARSAPDGPPCGMER
jgi:hypothetical protein